MAIGEKKTEDGENAKRRKIRTETHYKAYFIESGSG